MTVRRKKLIGALLAVVALRCAAAASDGDSDAPRLVAQRGHSADINAVAISPDGRLLLTGSSDHTACLWDMASGRELRCFTGHAEPVLAVAFSPDGRRALTASLDHAARLWDTATGERERGFTDPVDGLIAAAISPDGRSVVTGNNLGTTRLWDRETGAEIRQFQGGRSIAFSPDGRFLATGDRDGFARLWDVATGREAGRFPVAEKAEDQSARIVGAIAFSPDGRHLLTGGRDAVLWDIADGRELRRLTGDWLWASAVAFSPDGRRALVGEQRRTPLEPLRAHLWAIETGETPRRLVWPASSVTAATESVAFSPDGRQIVTAGGPEAILWDAASDREVRRFARRVAAVNAAALAPDGRHLLVAGDDGSARLWDLGAGRIAGQLVHASNSLSLLPNRKINAAALSPDGRWAATAGDKEVLLWDVATGRKAREWAWPDFGVHALAFSADGRWLLAGGGDGARLWDTATGALVRQFDSSFLMTVWAVALAPNGELAATGGSGIMDGREICLWRIATGEKLRCLDVSSVSGDETFGKLGEWGAPELAFSPDSRLFAVGHGKDLTGYTATRVKLFDAGTGEQRQTLAHDAPVSFVGFSPDGRWLLTGGEDGKARVWDQETGQERRRFEGHSAAVTGVIQAPDGRWVATTGKDGITRFWDAASGRELCRLIAFADGRWAVVDPAGRFDTDALDDAGLHWVVPDDPFTPLPLEIFMRDHYEPRLLPRVLAGEVLPPMRDLRNLNRVQPRVTITRIEPDGTAATKITVEVAGDAREFDRAGAKISVATGVHDLRLFRDGQLVGHVDGAIPLDPATGLASRALTAALPAWPQTAGAGRKIEFTAYAFNDDRVKSATARMAYAAPAIPEPRQGRAYLLNVGVDAHDNPAWDLRFAVNDARRLQQALAEQLSQTGDYAEIVALPLLAERATADRATTPARHATKPALRAALAKLAGQSAPAEALAAVPGADRLERARPEDLVVLSISGHGYTDERGDFYFVLADTGPGDGRQIDDALRRRSLSGAELAGWLRDVDAGELVLIVDACQAAATVESADFKPGPMGSRGLGQLAYDKGMRVLAASQADTVALESDRLQQGLLSYALVQDGLLARRADFGPTDRRITLPEWLHYGVARVPELYRALRCGGGSDELRGATVIGSPAVAGGMGAALQQPALFDFARRSAPDVVLWSAPFQEEQSPRP